MTHQNIVVDNVNIHYVESAKKTTQKPMQTLIFLHGFPEYWGSWKQQLNYFSDSYRVIAPDLPGYNQSDKPSEAGFYAVPNLIAFMAKFIAAISPTQPVILVAHDWGGAIAWPLAAFHPQLISKLIILNAAHPSTFTREMINNPIQRQKSAYIHQLISPCGESLVEKDDFNYLTEHIMVSTKEGVFTDEVRAQYRQVWRQDGAINGMLQYYRAMPQLAAHEPDDESENLSNKQPVHSAQIKNTAEIKIPNIRINIPTLVLWGEQDLAFVNDNLNDLNRYVANCTLIRFPNTSHWLHHERPDEVNRAIAEFIN
ncbi:alpha/beta hydrolase [Shewanella livingstonensis]|uniref:Alpha/beta hydrolase n=1 Tax=Shewanella livingstonensis TaxID=150120 RepID=A0A3G8M0L3_9GAMM|nr:alpha/beta hydrolase [Shewanella livingstonensis]